MINRSLKIGEKVWCYDNNISSNVDYIEITSQLIKKDNIEYYKYISNNHWSAKALLEHIFETKQEAEVYRDELKQKKYDDMASKINSVEDIIKLAYGNMFSEEYTNWTAINVVKDKTFELLGIDLK